MTRRSLFPLALSALPAAPAAVPPNEDLCLQTATSLAALLRAKKVSAREVLDAHLARIERLNPKLNAIVTLALPQARAAAERADQAAARGRFLGPLHGLPVAHKDLQETRGIRTTYGSPLFRDNVPQHNTLLIDRIHAAGAVPIGKTNVPEFGAGSQTFNPVFGPTGNPFKLTHTCGGSSGGAAAALAAHFVPLADGSDTGGSLRNPAAFCGVVGFRSSPGRIPRFPTGSPWNVLSVVGPLARNVADTALFLSAMAGPDPRAPLSLPEPGSRFARPLTRLPRGMRIAWASNLLGIPFHRDIRAVFARQREIFTGLGCRVADAEPDLTGADEVFKVFRALAFYQQHHEKVARHRNQIKETVIGEVERGAKLTGPEIAAAETARSRIHARVGEFFRDHDYLVLPTTQVPAFPHDIPYIREIEGVPMRSYIDWMQSCYFLTVTALPAISIPCGLTPDGLPVGLQIAGRPQDDFGVLEIAHAFEQARGFQLPIFA